MIKNVILLIILAVQVGVWFIVDSPFSEEKAKSADVKTNKLEDLPVDEIGILEVTDASGKTLTLAKRQNVSEAGDSVWVVDSLMGYPAVTSKVTEALGELRDMSKAEFRSEKRILHEDYEVDEAKGQKLDLFTTDRKSIASLIIGKQDYQGAQGTFIRFADDDKVYVSRSKKLGVVFSTEPYNWVHRAVMDIDPTDQSASLELRSACYKIEVEGQQQKRDESGRFLDPPAFETVRYVYERVAPGAEGGDTTWRVLEPDDKKDLVLADLQIKNLIGSILNMQMNKIISPGVKPEHGLDDDAGVSCKATLRFKIGDQETTRTLYMGNEFEEETVPGRPVTKMRYARSTHPGNPLQQSFVYAVHATYNNYYLRDPKNFVVRTPPTPKKPDVPKK